MLSYESFGQSCLGETWSLHDGEGAKELRPRNIDVWTRSMATTHLVGNTRYRDSRVLELYFYPYQFIGTL
jgi:hypothetical protein